MCAPGSYAPLTTGSYEHFYRTILYVCLLAQSSKRDMCTQMTYTHSAELPHDLFVVLRELMNEND